MKYQMRRGVSQSLYKYLPDSWIDFSVRGEERNNYIAHVKRWTSDTLDEINKQRLIRVEIADCEGHGRQLGAVLVFKSDLHIDLLPCGFHRYDNPAPVHSLDRFDFLHSSQRSLLD